MKDNKPPANLSNGKTAVPTGFDRRSKKLVKQLVKEQFKNQIKPQVTQEGVATWRSREFESIELHRGSTITQDYPRHWHDELYLCATIGGRRELDSAGGSYLTPPGSLLLIPSGEVHADRKYQCSFRCMFIEFRAFHASVEQFTEQAVPEIHFRTELISNERTKSSFLRLHRSLEEPDSELGRHTSGLLFFHKLVSEHSSNSLPSPRDGNEDFAVRRTKQHLNERYAEHVSLQDLAQLTGLSPYHLHRSFCRKIGMPPHAYQLHVRITQARSLLRSGRSISETASVVGFVDQSHFSRHFKKFTGVTPGQYLHPEQEPTRRPAAQPLAS